MKSVMILCVVAMMTGVLRAADAPKPDADGFYALFDGKTLDDWKVAKNAQSFKVVDGMISIDGPGPGHLFYNGPVKDHVFKNFHFKAEVMTMPGANSGIYFHTEFQEQNWPNKGFECQVNNTFVKDPRKTASLYGVKDVLEVVAKDNEWFQYEILVQGKQVTIKINGKTVNEYTASADQVSEKPAGKKLSAGTFALQAHDPGSKVKYRNVMVKPLAD